MFVAAFIGSPSMNLYDATISMPTAAAPRSRWARRRLPIAAETMAARPGLRGYAGKRVVLGIRPEDFEDAKLAGGVLEGSICAVR